MTGLRRVATFSGSMAAIVVVAVCVGLGVHRAPVAEHQGNDIGWSALQRDALAHRDAGVTVDNRVDVLVVCDCGNGRRGDHVATYDQRYERLHVCRCEGP